MRVFRLALSSTIATISAMTLKSEFRGVLLGCFASAFLMACHTPMQGRNWRMIDKRADWLSTSVGVDLAEGVNEGKERKEVWNKAGCLQWKATAFAADNVDKWYVYECIDWKVTPVVGRTSERLVITDPPNKEYMGASDKARPDEIVNIDHPTPKVERTLLPLSSYPVQVEWQLTATDGQAWLEAGNPKIVCSGSWAVSRDDQAQHSLSLCKPELEKVLATPADNFSMMFRVSPQGWQDAQRSSTGPSLLRSQANLTRDMIVRRLKQLSADGAVEGVPSAGKKPAPAAGTAPASPR